MKKSSGILIRKEFAKTHYKTYTINSTGFLVCLFLFTSITINHGKRGRQGKGKIPSLIERLFDYEAGVCLITKNFNVPFDINQAERDVGMIKVKTRTKKAFEEIRKLKTAK